MEFNANATIQSRFGAVYYESPGGNFHSVPARASSASLGGQPIEETVYTGLYKITRRRAEWLA